MRLSISRAEESVWVWMFWGFGFYLVLEAGAFFAAGWLLNKTVGQLAGPYVALAVPFAVLGPLVYRVNRRRSDPAERRARGMGVAAAIWIALLDPALYYSGVSLGLISERLAIVSTVVMWLFGCPIVYFAAYRTALAKARLSAGGSDGAARAG